MSDSNSQPEPEPQPEPDHDCTEQLVHYYFEGRHGHLQDAYDCAVCGALVQVG